MAEPARRIPLVPEDDPFRYGFRERMVRRPDGSSDYVQIPLTLDDLLNPQIDDHVTQSGQHFALVKDLFERLERRYASRDDVVVCADRKLLWRIAGLPDPGPDIMVIRGVRDKARIEKNESFDADREGARPCFIAEIVSLSHPELWDMDHNTKRKVYERAGVPEYLIVDPFSAERRLPLVLTGYRLGPRRRYRRIPPDSQERLLFETVGLLIGPAPDGQNLEMTDAVTGEKLLPAREEAARLREELERLGRG
ncbi:MAG TPA: Uma2 family endonuclease [Thermoanaerobaculia bacterium]|nr:Uma2 family endonuclease [Thermoanaerobaculia bacterium]